MQDLVRGLQSQSISDNTEFQEMRDSGTESDEEELTAMIEQSRELDEDLISMADPPAIRSSPPQPDADSSDSFGHESGILSDVDENFDEEPHGDHPPIQRRTYCQEECTFPVMSMDDCPGRNLRPRRCRVRVLVNRRRESESDMEIVIPTGISSPRRRAPKRPALDLEKMMRNRLDSSVSPTRKRSRGGFSSEA